MLALTERLLDGLASFDGKSRREQRPPMGGKAATLISITIPDGQCAVIGCRSLGVKIDREDVDPWVACINLLHDAARHFYDHQRRPSVHATLQRPPARYKLTMMRHWARLLLKRVVVETIPARLPARHFAARTVRGRDYAIQ